MGRREMQEGEVARRAAAVEVLDFAGKPRPPTKRRATGWDVEAARKELDAMLKSGDWEEARPKHFVELFLLMHKRVYGVEALEAMRGWKVRAAAASMASRLLKDHFGGDPGELAAFVRWVWQDQERSEQRRRAGTLNGDFRVSWRYQWSPGLVTNYRRSTLLEAGRARRQG